MNDTFIMLYYHLPLVAWASGLFFSLWKIMCLCGPTIYNILCCIGKLTEI